MEQTEHEVHFSNYLQIIKERKYLVMVFFFVTVFAVTAGSFLMKPVYRATVKLLIDVQSPDVLTATDSVALGSTNYYAYKEYLQSQQEIIKSRSIARQVFEEFALGMEEEYRNSSDPITKFLKAVRVEPIRDTRLLLLHVENEDPKLAAGIANRIAKIYVERNLVHISKSEVLNLLKNEYLRLQAKLSEYLRVYKAKHPKMIRLRQEIEQITVRIEEEKARSDTYSLSRDELSGTGSEQDSRFVLASLKANNITVQDPAEVPVKPQKPKKRLNMLLSVIVGLFGGVGLALFLDYLDDTVKTVEDVQRLVMWPFLGNVPDIGSFGKFEEFEKDLLALVKPKEPVAEAYRSVRTSILFSFTEGSALKSLIITSPGPEEGKSLTVCNLAIVMAQGGKKVLLVDADMRKNRLHTVFKVKNDIGLGSFLSGWAKFDKVVQETDIRNLSLVPSGPPPPNPSELLASRRTEEFINEAQKDFDLILFDAPPTAVVTDAIILSRVVDGTVIVIESGKTIKKILPRTDQMFKDAHARIIGVLMNKVSRARTPGYHYYSYYYHKA
jgi:capsular exopolysaccharide synthesis family protein